MESFAADGQDLPALDSDFNAERRANIAALNDAATHPDIAGEAGGLQRVIESAAARIANEGMPGGFIVIFRTELVEAVDVLELARAVGRFARKGPVAARRGG